MQSRVWVRARLGLIDVTLSAAVFLSKYHDTLSLASKEGQSSTGNH
jgi:hypothetical protein